MSKKPNLCELCSEYPRSTWSCARCGLVVCDLHLVFWKWKDNLTPLYQCHLCYRGDLDDDWVTKWWFYLPS